MSDVEDAMVAMQAIVRDIDPSPSPAPNDTNVWVYPKENEQIRFSMFPFVIISQFIFDVNLLDNRGIGGGRYQHKWKMQIDVFLAEGGSTDKIKLGKAERKQDDWYVAFSNEIFKFNNLSLSGEVDEIGPRIEYVVGNIPWRSYFTGWGIRFIVPVQETLCAS